MAEFDIKKEGNIEIVFGIIEAIEYKCKDFADDGVSGGGNG